MSEENMISCDIRAPKETNPDGMTVPEGKLV